MLTCKTVFLVCCLVTICQNGEATIYDEVEDPSEISKKSECVSISGKCFNADECCEGLTCADNDAGSSVDSPGRCVKSKDLRPCSTSADCDADEQEVCAVLRYGQGQNYCLPSSDIEQKDNSRRHPVPPPMAGRHFASYSKLLSAFGGTCETDADCQPYAANDPGSRLCCQQVRRGRQGTRRICDRVTPISACIHSR